MALSAYQEIKDTLRQLYVEDPRPWPVGFSGGSPRELRPSSLARFSTESVISRGKDSTLVAALVFDAILFISPEQRTKPVTVLCTGTRNGRSSHKRAQRSQRNRSGGGVSLSASNDVPRPRERERVVADRVRVVGRKQASTDGPGPLTIEARRELLTRLLKLQEETGLTLISDDELFLIQQLWKSARRPDDGGGVARIVTRQKGIIMSDWKETNRLRELREQIAAEKGIRADTLRRRRFFRLASQSQGRRQSCRLAR
jgi:hypothetical protein